MTMRWRDAALFSLRSYSHRHQTRLIERQQFLAEELKVVVAATVTVHGLSGSP